MGDVDWEYTAKIIKIINDWFDLFNTKTKFSRQSNAFGVDIEQQTILLTFK